MSGLSPSTNSVPLDASPYIFFDKKRVCLFLKLVAVGHSDYEPLPHEIAERLVQSERFMEQNHDLAHNHRGCRDWNDPRMKALGALVGGSGYVLNWNPRLSRVGGTQELQDTFFFYFTYAALHHWMKSIWRACSQRTESPALVKAICATAWTLDDKKLWLCYLLGYFWLDCTADSTGASLQPVLLRIWERIHKWEVGYKEFYARLDQVNFETTTEAEWEQLFGHFLKLLKANKKI